MSLTPGSPQWCRLVTASKVAAILGHSPWTSQRTIWHLMRGEHVEEETDAMLRGTLLESGVLAWWRHQHPEAEWLDEQPTYTLGDWAAATPDGLAVIDGSTVLVEAKTTSSADDWGTPGTDEIPAHYLTQAYWQMHVSGIGECHIAVLLPRLTFTEYVVQHDPEIGALLERRCKAFHDSLWTDPPPPLDDSLSTLECLRALHPDIDRGEAVEISYETAAKWLHAKEDLARAETETRARTSALYEAMGRAQYATCHGLTVARRQPSGRGVAIYKAATSAALTEIAEGAA